MTQKELSRPVAGGTVRLTKDNLLEWQLDMPASFQQTVELAYSVDYPENAREISGL